jgi:hypothetical protein
MPQVAGVGEKIFADFARMLHLVVYGVHVCIAVARLGKALPTFTACVWLEAYVGVLMAFELIALGE